MRKVKEVLRSSLLLIAAAMFAMGSGISLPRSQKVFAATETIATNSLAANGAGTSYRSVNYTPGVTGSHTFTMTKTNANASTGSSLRVLAGNTWVAGNNAATGATQTFTATIDSGVEYKIAFWTDTEATDYTITVTTPDPGSPVIATNSLAANGAGTSYRSVNYTAPEGGSFTFTFDKSNANASTGSSLRILAGNVWVASNAVATGATQTLTANLTSGVEYKIAFWTDTEATDYTITALLPSAQPVTVTETISSGIRDDDQVLGPRYVNTNWTSPISGSATFNMAWTNTGTLRYTIRELVSNNWVADSPLNGASPQSDTVTLIEGMTYKISTWSTSGWGDHTMTATYDTYPISNGEPLREAHTGHVDVNGVNGNVTDTVPFSVPGNGKIYISLNYDKDAGSELHLYLKDSTGAVVASTPTVWIAKGIEEAVSEGDYTIEVVAAAGEDDWHMEIYYEPTVVVQPTPQAGSPNIVVINTDDQRADSLGALPKMMNWFSTGGKVFNNGYVTTPSCCPSRAGLFTGQYNHNNGVLGQQVPELNQNESVQRKLKDAGYNTAFAGKFVHFWPQQLTAPHWDNWTYFKGGYYNTWINSDGVNQQHAGNTTIRTFDKGIEYIDGFKTADDSRPWFLHLTPVAPHKPSTPEPQYATAPVAPRVQTPNIDEADRSDKPPFVQNRTKTAASLEQLRLDMTRTLYTLDDQVDRLMTHLQNTGELSNTLVIFTSDNGYLWGEHKLDEKFMPYDVSVRVPFLVYWQGHVTPGSTDNRWVANIDITPTVLAAAGVPIPADTDGYNVLNSYSRDNIYTEYFRDESNGSSLPSWKSIRNSSYMYNEYYDVDETTVTFREYYDLVNDPYQLTNLLADGNPNNDPSLTAAQTLLSSYASCSGASCRP